MLRRREAQESETTGPTAPVSAGYVWSPKPVNVWVSMNPSNNLQLHVLQQLSRRLKDQGSLFVPVPSVPTRLGLVAQLGIGFGSNLREEINPSVVYGRMAKPRGSTLTITTAEGLPQSDLFDVARGQLLRKACHIGILVQGDPESTHVDRVLWASMAGNHRLLEGGENEEKLFDNLALRVLAHAGAEKVGRHEGDDDTEITWEQWNRSPIHRDISRAARALGRAGLFEDEVDLDQYGSAEQTHTVLRFLKRAALGEGMRSQIDPKLRVMGVTTTGGGKARVSRLAREGHLVPISQLTWKGYIRAIPKGCPITFTAPSVETHENGMVYLAGALANAGLVNGFDDFLRFLTDHFAQHDVIDILPSGLTPKTTCIDHFHRHPNAKSVKDSSKVEIVHPDRNRFPEIDFPCGVREAELYLLSALFQSKAFREPGPLEKVIIAILPGHGSVAVYGGPREQLTSMLINGMKMAQVAWV
jgi:hypothetical protein